jgi:hypothetical protein
MMDSVKEAAGQELESMSVSVWPSLTVWVWLSVWESIELATD